ncbi:carboxymuconolactone decarboxylase family protein [Ferirhizobium litorale]|uniref:carboxymuconolactone decarboxylase family protein n=1 Tax=Ferirhizobium litorale TaxID=2927786 RepID=UPI002892AFC7|nr:carboxymuconolactone decarboxylase family protein [Fererhizobium litorale]
MSTDPVDGAAIYSELRGAENSRRLLELSQGADAHAAIASLALDFVYGKVWSRDGLDRKQRSLVTIGVLIALRQFSELENHMRIGLENGLSHREIEEAIVQAAPYAGFPAAWSAATSLSDLAREAEGSRD